MYVLSQKQYFKENLGNYLDILEIEELFSTHIIF